MKKGISEDKAELLIREQQLRREVYNTIVSLTENVDEDMLQKSINNLDQSSWMELVEERYLGRICGFPLCNNAVKMKKSQKYRIDLRSKKIFERSADVDKFCSRDCFLRSAAVKAQLEVEPLWIRGNSQKKLFDFWATNAVQKPENVCDVKFVEEQNLITSLEALKIGDTADSDDDGCIEKDEEGLNDGNELHPFLLITDPHASSETANGSVGQKLKNEAVSECDLDAMKNQNTQLSDSEKLKRIRAKYNKEVKRSPIIIEAKPMKLQNATFKKDALKNFEKIIKEWYGAETISYLRFHKSRMVDLITEADLVTAQFYAGDHYILGNEELKDVFLPPVDSIDQAKQRISVLNEFLKPRQVNSKYLYWRLLEQKLDVNNCAQRALGVISTFRLTATNIVLEKQECDLAVAIIFRLLTCCDTSLMHFFPSDNMVSPRFANYLGEIRCDVMHYISILSFLLNELK